MATKPLTYIGMGGMAAMGWSMGAAIGAKLGRPDHLVVHLLGDASFGMTGMELETAVRMGLPTLTVVINNGGIGGGMMGMNRPGGTPLLWPNWGATLVSWHRVWGRIVNGSSTQTISSLLTSVLSVPPKKARRHW